MSKTFKVQYMQDGELKKVPDASRSFLSLLLTWIKSGVITKLEIENKKSEPECPNVFHQLADKEFYKKNGTKCYQCGKGI